MNMYEVYANDTCWGSWLASSGREAILKAVEHVCGPHWEDTTGLYAIDTSTKGITQ